MSELERKLSKAAKEFIEQPLDGILYDLDLLPEQTLRDAHRDWIRKVIEALYEKSALDKAPGREEMTEAKIEGAQSALTYIDKKLPNLCNEGFVLEDEIEEFTKIIRDLSSSPAKVTNE